MIPKKIALLSVSLILVATTACAHGTASGSNKPYFAGTDIYGTSRITDDELKSNYGKQLNICIQFFIQQDEKFVACKKDLENKIQNQFHFAFTDLSAIRYFKGGESPIYVTLDVVEPEDAPKRMSFMDNPTGHYADPDGLIKAWDEYLKIGFELLAKGELTSERPNCPAYHCIFGHIHPKLAPYEKIFVDGVAKNKDKLEDIFLHSQSDYKLVLEFHHRMARMMSLKYSGI